VSATCAVTKKPPAGPCCRSSLSTTLHNEIGLGPQISALRHKAAQAENVEEALTQDMRPENRVGEIKTSGIEHQGSSGTDPACPAFCPPYGGGGGAVPMPTIKQGSYLVSS